VSPYVRSLQHTQNQKNTQPTSDLHAAYAASQAPLFSSGCGCVDAVSDPAVCCSDPDGDADGAGVSISPLSLLSAGGAIPTAAGAGADAGGASMVAAQSSIFSE
jgi:hypothetical protein